MTLRKFPGPFSLPFKGSIKTLTCKSRDSLSVRLMMQKSPLPQARLRNTARSNFKLTAVYMEAEHKV